MVQRNKGFNIIALFFFLFGTINSQAQSILTDTLDEVLISDSIRSVGEIKSHFNTINSSKKFSTKQLKLHALSSVNDFLLEQSSVFIKSFGVNSFSGLNIRGSSSAQSQVIWQGLPLNNVASGVSDLSLLTLGVFEDIAIQYGGSGGIFGSGSVGGTLLLDSDDDAINKLLSVKVSSVNQLSGLARFGYKNENTLFKVVLFGENSKNNFNYFDNTHVLQKMDHAERTSLSSVMTFKQSIRLSTKFLQAAQLTIHLWPQFYDRNIPAALFESKSLKNQKNFDLRQVVSMQQQIDSHWLLYTLAGFINEQFSYEDQAININTRNRSNHFYYELGVKNEYDVWQGNGKLRQLMFIPISYQKINFLDQSLQHTMTSKSIVIVEQLDFLKQKILIESNLRLELLDNELLPVIFGSSVSKYGTIQSKNYQLGYKLFSSLQRSYRYPNLNELYFNPGGNTKLLPEIGWNIESGIQISNQTSSQLPLKMTFQVVNFNRWIDNWIYWFGGSILTPHNIAGVYSKGWDYQVNISQSITDKMQIAWQNDFCYTIAITKKSHIPNDKSIGKQIPYTPRYNFRSNIELMYKNVLFNAAYGYTGYRYTTMDEQNYLSPYNLLNLQAKYFWLLNKNHYLSFQVGINNVFQEEYYMVNQRPMPLRHTNLTITYNF